ncbi:MAG: phenylalanine--tRNA ligase subunit alpha [Acidilobaceae archaeon]|nr:phenylalanine--tRNA ligase subunit alpha [Acidilobaceae archaeon]
MVYALSEGEHEVLRLMKERGFTSGSLSQASSLLGLDRSRLASTFMLLKEKGILEVSESVTKRPRLTERGKEALARGLPEEMLVELLGEKGEVGLAELPAILGREASVAVGQARRKGLVAVEGGRVKLLIPKEEAMRRASVLRKALEECSEGKFPAKELYEEAKSRGLVEETEERELLVRVTRDLEEVMREARVEVSRLTSAMLRSGSWRQYVFRSYDVTAEPPLVLPARAHFLAEFIEQLRDVFKEMGFREVRGSVVELELFNFDLLFQAQDHPAREIHDSLWVKGEPADLSEYGELVERVAEIHERSWKYKWDPKVAARLVLRSQTTAVSARMLITRPKPPMRIFTIGRVYRRDAVDATHLPEFHQLDGIEGYPGYTFRELLGTLKDVFERLGLEVKFKPAYFPFTEPSVEGYVKLPSGRWLELFGAGLFRPEVLEMAGVDYPVGAWGFGIERLAAATYGIADIRVLYTSDVDFIRKFRARR